MVATFWSLAPRRPVRLSILAVTALALGACSLTPGSAPSRTPRASNSPAAVPAAEAIEIPALLPRPAIELEPLPERPRHLLARLGREFSLPGSVDATVQRELEWYASHPEYLERVFGRSERYLHYIAEELERRGMPADLALLPIVESAFDPFAYSHGRASGLWQIIPGTGRRLGLKQNWWYDGRRDVIESTRAAFDYLALMHGQFGGDWLLAVAGYNSGEGNVARALKRAEAAGQPTDFWGIRRYLPVETRTYVPRLLAIRDLVADPARFGVSLPELDDKPYFAVIETGSQIDMALAANLSGLELDRLYELNPGVNRWATDPDGPHRLLVPIAHSEPFAQALDELGERERVQWTRHQIRTGETLSQLALRYQTTEAVLREINDLRGNTIRAGGHLMIPHATRTLEAYTQSVDARAERQQNRERPGERIAYVVRPGDSLWSIAGRYKTGVRELASWNAMAPGDMLSVGRELVIWSDSATLATSTQTPAQTPAQIRRVNYVVRRGDSLYSIAQRFRVTIGELVQWNGVSTKKYLQPGQRLVMYVDVTEQST